MTHSRLFRIIVPLIVLAALVGLFAVVGTLAGHGGSSGGTSSGGAASRSAVGMANDGGYGFKAAEPAPAGHGSSDVAADLPDASAPSSHYLVRNGSLALLVARGSLMAAVDRVTALTTGMNGYVVSSSVGSEPVPWPTAADSSTQGPSTGGGGQAVSSSGDGYASITVRVPGDAFDAALRRYASIGKVQSVATSSDDVTSQYVDLQARLDHYKAVERRLVRFLAATTTVNQMLAVQDRIDRVQLTIEQLTAEFKALRETTTYGTIVVSLSEKGRHVAPPAGSSFGGTFWHSMRLLARGARATALAVVAVLPFVVVLGGLALAGWLAARRYRRRRPPAEPSLPA